MFALTRKHTLPHRLLSGGPMHHLHLGFAAWRQRQHLRNLDDRMLEDIGITRAQADSEATKPVWDVPRHWLQK